MHIFRRTIAFYAKFAVQRSYIENLYSAEYHAEEFIYSHKTLCSTNYNLYPVVILQLILII